MLARSTSTLKTLALEILVRVLSHRESQRWELTALRAVGSKATLTTFDSKANNIPRHCLSGRSRRCARPPLCPHPPQLPFQPCEHLRRGAQESARATRRTSSSGQKSWRGPSSRARCSPPSSSRFRDCVWARTFPRVVDGRQRIRSGAIIYRGEPLSPRTLAWFWLTVQCSHS